MVQKVPNSMLVSGGGGGGGGAVNSVTAGTNVTVTGTASDPVVNVPSIGVKTITAGTGVTLGGTATDPVINASGTAGVSSITAGTNVTLGGTASVPVVNVPSIGVVTVTAGTNVTIGGTATNPVINATGGGGGGVLVQRKYNTNSTPANVGAVTAPQDNTPPLRTETTLAVSLAFTPTSGTNYIDIFGSVPLSSAAAVDTVVVCIFDSATSTALSTACISAFSAGGYMQTATVHHRILASSTTARTYELRVSGGAANNIAINGWGGTPTAAYGGTMASRILVEECTP